MGLQYVGRQVSFRSDKVGVSATCGESDLSERDELVVRQREVFSSVLFTSSSRRSWFFRMFSACNFSSCCRLNSAYLNDFSWASSLSLRAFSIVSILVTALFSAALKRVSQALLILSRIDWLDCVDETLAPWGFEW